MLKSALKSEFIKLFREISKHEHPYSTWSDLVHMWSFAFQNAILKHQDIEDRYLQIAGKYDKEKLSKASKMLAIVIQMLEIEPADVLGPLYMELEIANKNSGQFFTPPELSKAIAMLLAGNNLKERAEKEDFVTLLEPSCGAGGMILSYINIFIQNGLNPAEKIWVSAIDIDPVVARMCHIQLSLWNVPAEVTIGNTLTLEIQEVIHTPAHHLGFWGSKIRRKLDEQNFPAHPVSDINPEPEKSVNLYRMVKDGDLPYEDLTEYKEQLGLDF